MAASVPIELVGIAFDRDVVVAGEIRGSTSVADLDDEIQRHHPWLPLTTSPTALSCLSPYSSSPSHLISDGYFSQSTGDPESLLGSRQTVSLADEMFKPDPSIQDLGPLDRFASVPQRHEELALSLCHDARYQLPYHDYLPCPGSGPGSPAVSVATDNIPPAAIPKEAMPLLEILKSRTVTNIFSSPKSPSDRDISDSTGRTQEWLALILEEPPGSPSPEDSREHFHPDTTVYLDPPITPKDRNYDSDSSVTVTNESSTPPSRKRTCSMNGAGDAESEGPLAALDAAAALRNIASLRRERVINNGLRRSIRHPRVRVLESPPQKKAKLVDDRKG